MIRQILACGSLAALLLFSPAASAELAPPPPIDPGGQPAAPPGSPGAEVAATTAKLDAAEKEDSGRNFELVWVNGDVGGSYINMQQFSASTLQIEKSKAAGLMVGLGAGLRLVVLSLGVRGRYNALSSFSMWQLNGEVGFKLPVRSVDILIGVHGGWAWLGSLSNTSLSTSTERSAGDVSVRGFNAGLELGFDYYLASTFSIGLGMNGDFLFLKRPPVAIPTDVPAEQKAAIEADPLYKNSGDSIGFGVGGALRLGLHFGL